MGGPYARYFADRYQDSVSGLILEVLDEFAELPETMRATSRLESLGDLPLTVLSTRGEHVGVHDASHYIQFDQPARVLGAIQAMMRVVGSR